MPPATDSTTADSRINTFIARWAASGAAERANLAGFIYELCALLDVPTPEPTVPDDTHNAYVFERAVTFDNPDGTKSSGRIDLYKRGCFVLEAKQGTGNGERRTSNDDSNDERRTSNDDSNDERRTSNDEKEKMNAPDQTFPPPRPRGGAGGGVEREAARLTSTRLKKGTARRGTKGWDDAMMAARGQAEQYVRALPADEGNPPFIVVVDVGHSIELYSDFSRAGKTYVPFPDARNHRIMLADLAREDVRERLRALWSDPMSLDPSRRSAKVTREVADRLATLARSIESSGHAPEEVAQFLMRCIFTMFAEDVKLVPERAFTALLEDLRQDVSAFPDTIRSLWSDMDRGGFSGILRKKLLRFNGGLFENVDALPLTAAELELLIDAGRSDWHDVEPAIFGTLLERALDPVERHKLGAHYTPRAYVERLVMPTIVEPLREEWDATRAATVALMNGGSRDEAVKELRTFHHRLCTTKVLDPACGTGNFLYVTLEHLKRLEGEVLDLLSQLGESTQSLELTELTVDPHQLLGIEINPRAAAIADLVLWIGYLQWHFRTYGDTLPREPVLHKYDNIENRDALLEYDAVGPQLDADGAPVTRWDGRTMKKHPVTGEDVPDDTARVPVMQYVNPRKAEWPEAEFIVGNPPFLGKLKLMTALGEGYVASLRNSYLGVVPDGADLVMYWWERAAEKLSAGSIKQFGFITTNSITQPFNRRILSKWIESSSSPIRLRFAIPDHPWVDAADGAAVRIAMTVAASEAVGNTGTVVRVLGEIKSDSDVPRIIVGERVGIVHSDLRVGPNLTNLARLASNSTICTTGLIPGSRGFFMSLEDVAGVPLNERNLISPILNGRDLMDLERHQFVVDTYGVSEAELRARWPTLYQRLYDAVYPERRTNRDERLRREWWLFRRSSEQLRQGLRDLDTYIATPETAKHRVFTRIGVARKPEHKLIVIATSDSSLLGVLSSRAHTTFALAAGGQLGPTPVYSHSQCFQPYPFPDAQSSCKEVIATLAEQLDAHRKRQQALHPTLTITDMYNVLEKLRSGEALTAKEKKIHEEGLVSVLKEIHDELDRAVLEAYGWSDLIPMLAYERREEFEAAVLERLVALNHERAAEERSGLVRWLRPEYQAPAQGAIELPEKKEVPGTRRKEAKTRSGPDASTGSKIEKQPWPKTIREQTQAVRSVLAASGAVMSAEEIAKRFTGARVERIGDVLETLEGLGVVRLVDEGRYVV